VLLPLNASDDDAIVERPTQDEDRGTGKVSHSVEQPIARARQILVSSSSFGIAVRAIRRRAQVANGQEIDDDSPGAPFAWTKDDARMEAR